MIVLKAMPCGRQAPHCESGTPRKALTAVLKSMAGWRRDSWMASPPLVTSKKKTEALPFWRSRPMGEPLYSWSM